MLTFHRAISRRLLCTCRTRKKSPIASRSTREAGSRNTIGIITSAEDCILRNYHFHMSEWSVFVRPFCATGDSNRMCGTARVCWVETVTINCKQTKHKPVCGRLRIVSHVGRSMASRCCSILLVQGARYVPVAPRKAEDQVHFQCLTEDAAVYRMWNIRSIR
jgi:hypothetical protein